MKSKLAFVVVVGAIAATTTIPTVAAPPANYFEALELIQAYSGAGDELDRAMAIARELSRSQPDSGLSHVLLADASSTWRLNQSGEPADLREQILSLADEALRLDPTLAHAHVAKARVYVRASMHPEATAEIDAALALDPELDSAVFLRAEIYRRSGQLSEADVWYRKFIESTPTSARKSNGYGWLATMYQDAAWTNSPDRDMFTAKAREAHERTIELDPLGAWKNVNFAVFLNEYVADYDGAERYAERALEIMEFPMARYHLAAARYQKVWASPPSVGAEALESAIAEVASSTEVSLEEAIAFRSFSTRMRRRLEQLQSRSQEAAE